MQQQTSNIAKETLQRVRALRNSRILSGVDGICKYVENVDGDWLENWCDENALVINAGDR